MNKTIVVIPTYNEKENIVDLINKIKSLSIKNLHILVVDDNSPDGTAQIVKDLKDPVAHVLLRTKNKGRGSAGRAGFIKALEEGADTIIEMDADLSHDPNYIPQMLKTLESCDVVLGSRMVAGGEDVGRSPIRQLITKLANLYIRIVLGINVKDCNSGYRCFSKRVFDRVHLEHIFSTGPAIVQELLYKCHLTKCKIREIPIIFRDRTKGESTLTLSKIIKGYLTILSLKYKRVTRTLKI